MKRRLTALLLAACLAAGIAAAAAEGGNITIVPSVMETLRVGNPTAM